MFAAYDMRGFMGGDALVLRPIVVLESRAAFVINQAAGISYPSWSTSKPGDGAAGSLSNYQIGLTA